MIRAGKFLGSDQTAIVVFVYGYEEDFYTNTSEEYGFVSVNKDGHGRTGNWNINGLSIIIPGKIMIYLRSEESDLDNTIFIGDLTGYKPCSDRENFGKVIFDFTNLSKIGKTQSNWVVFSGGHVIPAVVLGES